MARKRTLAEERAALEALKLKQKQTQARIRDLEQRERAAERKQRNHALMVYGAMVEQHLGGGDWTRLDVQAVSAYLARFAGTAAARDCAGDPKSAADAAKEIREWEATGREARKAEREKIAKALED